MPSYGHIDRHRDVRLIGSNNAREGWPGGARQATPLSFGDCGVKVGQPYLATA
ncbi:hypothetical protein GCM10022235_85790 [Kribbella ginsengisoli]|uniref:Uncharacterized protein n=1 Tax=Kribbella ginsengisoli TaxID=363865 RepID=A0ABP6Z999_9ACTN